jgi:hypothetical protein
LRGRRALKEILEPLLGEQEPSVRRESPRRHLSPAPAFGAQVGLQAAYVRVAPDVLEAPAMSRHVMTREELP